MRRLELAGLRVALDNLNARQLKHLFGEYGVIVLVEDDPYDASLNDHLGAQLAWERRRVDSRTERPRPARLHDCRLLGVQAQTLVKVDALVHVIVAPFTAAVIAVVEAERCPVVASRDDTLVFGDDGTVATLHTVGAARRQLSQPHEVGVEGWADQLAIFEVEL